MSGFEIAGVVLGAFPIVIEGIKVYSSGIKSIKDMKNYQQVLGQFARELKVEKCKFENTCLELLEQLVDPAQLKRMMADLRGDEWKDKNFRRQLKNQLRPADKTLENWEYIATELNDTLVMVAKRFQLPQDSIKKPTWKNPIARTKFDPRRAWEVTMLASYRHEQIAKIRQLNADLGELANGSRKSFSRPSSPNPPKIDTYLVAYHKRIQDHARFLYCILREKLESPRCKCGIPHLELQMRGTPPTKALSKPQVDIPGPNKFLTFNLMFLMEKSAPEWKEFQLEHIDESRKPNDKCPLTEGITLSPPTSSGSSAASTPERGRSMSREKDNLPSTLRLGVSPTSPKLSSSRFSASFQKLTDMFLRKPSPSPSSTATHKTPQIGHPQNPTTASISSPTARQQCSTPTKRTRFARCSDDHESDESDNNSPQLSNNAYSDKLPTIQCFCTTLTTYTATHHPTITTLNCVGILIGIDNKKHRVWPTLQMSPRPSRLVSLTDLMTNLTNINTPSRRDRLVLGLKLISSVLQLNTTEWLTGIWGAGDIFFPETDLKALGQYKKILSRPFVRQKFNVCSGMAGEGHLQSQEQSASQAMREIIGCNQSLYSLGIILLEIWHWQKFSSMLSSSAMGHSELFFAYRLSDQLFEEAGYQYGIAVRRCIRGLDMPESDLKDDLFRRKVYEDVLGPLEDNLKMFCRRDDLKDVIEE